MNGNSSVAANTPRHPASWYLGNLCEPLGRSLTQREGRAVAVKQEFRGSVCLGEHDAQLTGSQAQLRAAELPEVKRVKSFLLFERSSCFRY